MSAFLKVKAITTGMPSRLDERMSTLDLTQNGFAKGGKQSEDRSQPLNDYFASAIEINALSCHPFGPHIREDGCLHFTGKAAGVCG